MHIKLTPWQLTFELITNNSSFLFLPLLTEQSIPSPTRSGSGPDTSMTPNHTGSIHLWQFLKELLLQPESYSYCIRWLDRSQGKLQISSKTWTIPSQNPSWSQIPTWNIHVHVLWQNWFLLVKFKLYSTRSWIQMVGEKSKFKVPIFHYVITWFN